MADAAQGAVPGGSGTDKSFFGHPRGLFVLFFAELWERFSFYGMRALLTLYMVKELLYSDERAAEIYGAYGALVYAFPVLGGAIADKLTGYRYAVMVGAIMMAIGHFVMAIQHEVFFYSALAFLCVGNGFFKPNISTIVGRLYTEDDPRRDGGFTIFYMGINIGAMLAPLTCGFIGETYGWHYGFGLAGIGMLIGLVVFGRGKAALEGHGEPPNMETFRRTPIPGMNAFGFVLLLAFVLVAPVAAALYWTTIADAGLYVAGAGVLLILISTATNEEAVGRDRLISLIILMFFHTTFWACFEQAGTSLTLFADRNVDRMLFDVEIKASMLQAVNPSFIIIFAPLFTILWTRLSRRDKSPSIPNKFALGLVQLGLGFGVLVLGARFADDNGQTWLLWLIMAYLLHTTGELCLSPVGLSAVTKLAPLRLGGLVMGAWFLSISFAHHIAGAVAALTGGAGDSGGGEGEVVGSPETLEIYTGVFWKITIVVLAVSALLFVISPFIKRLMHGVK